MEARYDSLPERGGPFLPGYSGGGAQQAAVLGQRRRRCCVPHDGLLQLEADLGRVEGDGAYLREKGEGKSMESISNIISQGSR